MSIYLLPKGFLCGSAGKESTCNAGDLGSIPGLGRSPGEGKGYPSQYSGLENPMDRRAWWATVHGVAESLTATSLSLFPVASVKNLPASAGDARDLDPILGWVGKSHWRRKWQPTLAFLPGKSHGQRRLAGYCPWG